MNYFFGVLLVMMGMCVFGVLPALMGGIAYKHSREGMTGTRFMALAAIFLGVFWFFALPVLSISHSASAKSVSVPVHESAVPAPARLSASAAQSLVQQHSNSLLYARKNLKSNELDSASGELMEARALRTTHPELPEELNKAMLDAEREVDDQIQMARSTDFTSVERPTPALPAQLDAQKIAEEKKRRALIERDAQALREAKAADAFAAIQAGVKGKDRAEALRQLSEFVQTYHDAMVTARARAMIRDLEAQIEASKVPQPVIGSGVRTEPAPAAPPPPAPKKPGASVGEQNPFD